MTSLSPLTHAALMPEDYAEYSVLWTDDYASLFSIINPPGTGTR
jgi:hypothetical protein